MFYERRIRRLFPPLVPVLLFTSVFALIAHGAEELSEYGQSLVAALALVSNWFFGSLSGYFETAAETKPLLHTWSLSVEEQFYLIFPILILALRKFKRAFIIVFFALLVAASFAYGRYLMSSGHMEWAFYSAPARFWEIGIGGLLAATGIPGIKSGFVKNLLGLSGLALIGYALFGLTDQSAFPGYNALPPTIGTAMIIIANGGLVGRILSVSPMVKIGLISYALYLWHWPIFVFLNYLWPAPTEIQIIFGVVMAIALSAFSYVFIEQPIRNRHIFRSRLSVYAAFAVITVLIGAFGAFVRIHDGLPARVPEAVAEYEYSLAQKKRLFVKYSAVNGCWLRGKAEPSTAIPRCVAESSEKSNVLVIGDSHSAHLMFGLRQSFPAINFNQLSSNSCPLVLGEVASERKNCMAIIKWPRDRSNLEGYDAIIISTRGSSYRSFDELSKWAITLTESVSAKIFVFGPAPFYAPNMPSMYPRLIGKPEAKIDAAFDRALETDRIDFDTLLTERFAGSEVNYISLYDVQCSRIETECRHLDNEGQLALIDNSHFSSKAYVDLIERLKAKKMLDFKS